MSLKFSYKLKFLLIVIFFGELFFLAFNNRILSQSTSPQFINEHSTDERTSLYNETELSTSISFIFGKVSTWRRAYEIKGQVIRFDSLGNCYFIGTIVTEFFQQSDIILGKINTTGSIQWFGVYNYHDLDEAIDLVVDEQENRAYIIGSSFNNTKVVLTDLFIGCYNLTNGEEIWNEEVGEELVAEIGCSAIIVGENLIITGIVKQYLQLNQESNLFLRCLNKTSGETVWYENHFNSEFDYNPHILYESLNEHIVVIFNRNDGNGEKSLVFFEYSLIGEFLEEEIVNSNDDFVVNDITFDFDRNYFLLIGDCREFENNEFRDIKIVQLDFNYNEVKNWTIGEKNEDDFGYGISYYNSIMVICGVTSSDVFNTYVAFITKLDSNGNIIWTGKNEVYLKSILYDIEINNQGYIAMTGYCQAKYDFVFNRLLIGFTIDQDDDGLSSFFEEEIGTNPFDSDSDHDGFSDGQEYKKNTDPLNKNSNLRTRFFWNNFSIVSFFIIIGIFILIHFLFTQRTVIDADPSKRKSAIVNLFDYLRNKIRKKNNE